MSELYRDWSNAIIKENFQTIQHTVSMVFEPDEQGIDSIKLLLKGTPFRIQVWQALVCASCSIGYCLQSYRLFNSLPLSYSQYRSIK